MTLHVAGRTSKDCNFNMSCHSFFDLLLNLSRHIAVQIGFSAILTYVGRNVLND